jgi:hypothetical protein
MMVCKTVLLWPCNCKVSPVKALVVGCVGHPIRGPTNADEHAMGPVAACARALHTVCGALCTYQLQRCLQLLFSHPCIWLGRQHPLQQR